MKNSKKDMMPKLKTKKEKGTIKNTEKQKIKNKLKKKIEKQDNNREINKLKKKKPINFKKVKNSIV